jgi:ABC-type molybdate transport system substrate-binding protein
MVIAYDPKSKYASKFKAYADGSKPLSTLFSTLLQTSGFKLGRTDPNTDPQGRDFIYMLELAQKYYRLPSATVAKILGTSDFGTSNSSHIYAGSTLDSTLQSASWTRPARSPSRRSSCTRTTSRCRRRSTSATPPSPRPTRRRRLSSRMA